MHVKHVNIRCPHRRAQAALQRVRSEGCQSEVAKGLAQHLSSKLFSQLYHKLQHHNQAGGDIL